MINNVFRNNFSIVKDLSSEDVITPGPGPGPAPLCDIFVISGDFTELARFDRDGNEIWRFEFGAAVYSIATDSDCFLYIGTNNDTVHKLDEDGNEIWVYSGGFTGNVNDIAVDPDGFVYAGSSDDTVRKLDSDGNEVWIINVGDSCFGLAIDQASSVYAGARSDLVKIEEDGNGDPQIQWTYTGFPSNLRGVGVDTNGFVYACSNSTTGENSVVCKLDASNGAEVWCNATIAGEENINTLSTSPDGSIYVGSSENELVKLDNAGNVVWRFSFAPSGDNASVISSALDIEGFVYGGSNDNTLRKIEEDGSGNPQEVWRVTFDFNVLGIGVTPGKFPIFWQQFQ
jgi:hypothetical protein